jgi:hypothetical protein
MKTHKFNNFIAITSSLLIFFTIGFFTQISNCQLNNSIDDSIKKDVEDIKILKRKTKLAACSSILRNNLNNGNESMKAILKQTNFDKEKTYDYVVTYLLSNCVNSITQESVDSILDPDNIFTSNIKLENELFSINPKLLENKKDLEYTNDMLLIQSDLKESILSESVETNMTVEEEIGIFGIKLNQPGTLQYIFLIIGILLTLIVVFGGMYSLIYKDKSNKKKKKNQ